MRNCSEERGPQAKLFRISNVQFRIFSSRHAELVSAPHSLSIELFHPTYLSDGVLKQVQDDCSFDPQTRDSDRSGNPAMKRSVMRNCSEERGPQAKLFRISNVQFRIFSSRHAELVSAPHSLSIELFHPTYLSDGVLKQVQDDCSFDPQTRDSDRSRNPAMRHGRSVPNEELQRRVQAEGIALKMNCK